MRWVAGWLAWACFSATFAHAGTLRVVSAMPARIVVDEVTLAQLHMPGTVELNVEDGTRRVRVVSTARSGEVEVTVSSQDVAVVVAGRQGLSAKRERPRHEPLTGPVDVRIVGMGVERMIVQVGDQRLTVDPGTERTLPLEGGEHVFKVRSGQGTALYARGVLRVGPGGDDRVVHVTAGALPETAGAGLRFVPDGA